MKVRTENELVEPGPKLDALVARKVMKWRLEPDTGYAPLEVAVENGWYSWVDKNGDEIMGQLEENQFSTDITAAWKPAEQVPVALNFGIHRDQLDGQWIAYWLNGYGVPAVFYSDSAPFSICLCALSAAGLLVKPGECGEWYVSYTDDEPESTEDTSA